MINQNYESVTCLRTDGIQASHHALSLDFGPFLDWRTATNLGILLLDAGSAALRDEL